MKKLLKILSRKYLDNYNKEYLNDSEFKVTKNGINIVFGAKKSIRKNLNFKLLVTYIDDLPKNIQEKLAKEKVIIRFVNTTEMENFIPEDLNILSYMSKEKYSLLIAGLFHYTETQKLIYINADTMFCSLKDTLFHEIGHFIDRCMFEKNTLSTKDLGSNVSFFSQINSNMLEAYKYEKEIYKDMYSKKNIMEFFASSCAIILKKNEMFEKKAVNTSIIIHNCINSIC